VTDQAERLDDADLEDIAVVAPGAQTTDVEPHEDVVRAIRYLLYRYELTSGSTHLPQMIAVVSASAGEGVTTVSRSLAHVLAAERGTRVCWIDVGGSEALPPSLGRGNLAELPGVGTTLREVPSGRAVAKPDPSGIRLVPAGEAPRGQPSGPARGAAELDDLLNSLAAEYRHVIFDTPPLLSRVDSIGFLRHAEAYILVTKQGSTTLKQIRTISEELQPIPSLGAILNVHRTRTPRFVRRFFRE
jgi:Mrp family chromosome partitioning ATPase